MDSPAPRVEEHPHPLVAVDVALLTVQPLEQRAALAVLVHRRDEGWALPGRFLRIDETLEQAALTALREKVGVTGERPRQLRVFDDPSRDPRYRVLSVAHVDLVPIERLRDALRQDVLLAPLQGDPVRTALPRGRRALAFDHDQVVREAVQWARAAYADRPDPSHLLDEQFTLAELHRVHEAVQGTDLQVDTFRRRMKERLEPTGAETSGAIGRPARLYRRLDPVEPQPGASRRRLPAQELPALLDRLGASEPVRELALRVQQARPLVAALRSSYVSLAGAGGVAIYVHPTRVSLALDPDRAVLVVRELPGAVLQPRSTATTYVVLDGQVLAAAPQASLKWALEAADRQADRG